jgi:hypothetical protein
MVSQTKAKTKTTKDTQDRDKKENVSDDKRTLAIGVASASFTVASMASFVCVGCFSNYKSKESIQNIIGAEKRRVIKNRFDTTCASFNGVSMASFVSFATFSN